jgi:hypothetical protein
MANDIEINCRNYGKSNGLEINQLLNDELNADDTAFSTSRG